MGVSGFAFHTFSRAQVGGPCWQIRALPREDDLVSAKEKLGTLSLHFRLDVMCCPWCCLGRRTRPWRRAGRVANADGCCFCLTADAPARSLRVSWFAGWVFQFWNQYLVTCQCLWFVLRRACCRCWLFAGSLWNRIGVMHLVRFVRI